MSAKLWIMVSILVLLIALGIVATFMTKKKKHPPDYYALFTMGIIWLAVGLPLKNPGLWTMGLIFFIIGLANKNKWKENRKDWNSMDKDARKMTIIIMTALGVLVLIGLAIFLLFQKGII